MAETDQNVIPDISQMSIDGILYNIKDAEARDLIAALTRRVDILEAANNSSSSETPLEEQ